MIAPPVAARSARLPGALPLVAAALLAAGCRTAWPAPPSDEARARFGRMALRLPPGTETDLGRPVTGWAAGLGFGTVRGAGGIVVFPVVGVAVTGGPTAGILAPIGGVLGLAAGIGYFPVSVVAGAATAADGDEVDEAEAVLRPVVEDPALAAALADRFSSDAWLHTGLQFGPEADAETVVELRLESVGGGMTWNLVTVDRAFEVRVVASARVVRCDDGRALWEAVRVDSGGAREPTRRRFVEWAEFDGAEMREEIDAALRRLASGLSWSIFVQRERTERPPDAGWRY